MAWILDDAGFVTGTYDGPGQPANSTSITPPDGAALPLRFVSGAWAMPADVNGHVSLLAFYNRFTSAERLAVRSAQSVNPVVADFMMLVAAAKYIDLGSDGAKAGVGYLSSVGLLTVARAGEILTAAITDAERP